MADAAEIDLNNVDIEALALQIFLHQNRQMEAMMMAAARLAALEVMAMEGDDGDMEDGLGTYLYELKLHHGYMIAMFPNVMKLVLHCFIDFFFSCR